LDIDISLVDIADCLIPVQLMQNSHAVIESSTLLCLLSVGSSNISEL